MTEFLAVSGADLRTYCKFQLSDQKVKLLERVVYTIYMQSITLVAEKNSQCLPRILTD